MATTATKLADLSVGNVKGQVWVVEIAGGDTTATWDTGLDNVLGASITTTADQAFGGVYYNYSDAGSTVAAGNVHIAGLANSSLCRVVLFGT